MSHYSEEIGERNFWMIQILIVMIVLLFLLFVFSFIGVEGIIQKEIQQKTAAANSGS